MCQLFRWSGGHHTASLLFAFLAAIATGSASADTITASFLSAGSQTPSATGNVETFNSAIYNGSSYTTSFGGSNYTGTYTGSLLFSAANQYGGAGGTGGYAAAAAGTSYSLALDHGANFFGLWFSALDNGNLLQFYSGSTLVYSFGPTQFISLVGSCPASGFCGNPTTAFHGQDGGELFAYLNFYDTTGTFDRIVFTQTGSGGAFESDNQAVALISTSPGGTVIAATPEPATWIFGLTGIAALTIVPTFKLDARNRSR